MAPFAIGRDRGGHSIRLDRGAMTVAVAVKIGCMAESAVA